MQSDILFLQETYMSLSMQIEYFANFNCIKHGLMILIKKHITMLEHIHFEEHIEEALLAKIIVHGSQISILNIYASPHANLKNILNVIAKDLWHLDLKDITIIFGDFNIYML